MKVLGIEETLFAYFKKTGKDWDYIVKYVEQMPDEIVRDFREVCINNTYIKFWETPDYEIKQSIVYWVIDFKK